MSINKTKTKRNKKKTNQNKNNELSKEGDMPTHINSNNAKGEQRKEEEDDDEKNKIKTTQNQCLQRAYTNRLTFLLYLLLSSAFLW